MNNTLCIRIRTSCIRTLKIYSESFYILFQNIISKFSGFSIKSINTVLYFTSKKFKKINYRKVIDRASCVHSRGTPVYIYNVSTTCRFYNLFEMRCVMKQSYSSEPPRYCLQNVHFRYFSITSVVIMRLMRRYHLYWQLINTQGVCVVIWLKLNYISVGRGIIWGGDSCICHSVLLSRDRLNVMTFFFACI